MLKNQLIGLFGGAFDPIHNAHISIAKESIEQIGLNKIIFIPTGGSANNKTLVSHRHRLEMINLICNNSHFEVSDFEIKEYLNNKKNSYTINTLRFFSEDSKSTFFFILGSDAFSSINSWYKWKELLDYSHLLLVERCDNKLSSNDMPSEVQKFLKKNITKNINDLKKYKHGLIYNLSMPFFDNSSSEIKNRLRKSLDVKNLLPKIIQEYIAQHNLY
jgi:nicotinate-nucleotide adenylyltransferase